MGTVINPNGKPWYATASGITFIGTTKTYQTYADMLREQYPGKLAWVVDASGDPSVDKGSALYAWRPLSKAWEKIYETEMMDGGSSVIQNFVGWVATPEQLRSMYPTASDGWYAIVGTTDSIWVWDSDTNDWKDTTAMDGEIMWSQIVDPPASHPINFITGLRDELDDRVLNATLEEFYPKKADLALVATTGSYTDLTNLPDIDGIITKLDTLSGAVEDVANEKGLGIVRQYGGHGVGRQMHEEPFVFNYRVGNKFVIKDGMTIAIEPMLNLGGDDVHTLEDEWTVVTNDGRPSAHFEHTIHVTDGDAEILTKLM